MDIILPIWMILIGILGAASLIIAKTPVAKNLIGKLQTVQGWIGTIALIWGIWRLIQGILNLGTLGNVLIMVTYFLSVFCLILLGFLLGIGIIRSFVKSTTGKLKLQALAVVLGPWQARIGLLSIGLGLWDILVILGILGEKKFTPPATLTLDSRFQG